MITRRASETDLRAHQRKHSSGSLLENALRKAIAGITTVDDAFETGDVHLRKRLEPISEYR